MFWQAIIPPDKGTGRVHTAKCLFPWNSELLVLGRSVCEENGVVVRLECGKR